MRALVVFGRCLREQVRDPWMLGLSLAFAPAMVLLYGLAFSGSTTTFKLVVVNQDRPVQRADGSWLAAGDEAIAALQELAYANGAPLLRLRQVGSQAEAEGEIGDRNAIVFLVIPPGFSQAVAAAGQGGSDLQVEVVFGGDLTHPYYPVAAVLTTGSLDQYVQHHTGRTPPLRYAELALGASGARTEFETYVPGILVFSVIMLVFLASMTVAREIESGTLRRLLISPMRTHDLLIGIGLSILLLAVVSIALTFLTALGLGFRSQGPIWLAVAVGILTAVSIIGIGLIVAALSRSVTQAFVIANFPLGILMFLSGAAFPLPPAPLVTLAGRPLGPYDLLPPTHAVVALNKVMTLGAGLDQIAFELAALACLSAAYLVAGLWLFQRERLRLI